MLAECVNRPFYDLKARTARNVGDRFECDEARLAEINSAGYGVMAVEVKREQAADYAAMTVRELTALIAERGKAVPRRARKADLVAILESE